MSIKWDLLFVAPRFKWNVGYPLPSMPSRLPHMIWFMMLNKFMTIFNGNS